MSDEVLLNRYRILDKFADGGMSHVFKSEDLNLERLVAIKFVNSLDFSNLINKELELLLRMRSKHVVEVYDVVGLNGHAGIVMEYISGHDLFNLDIQKYTERDFLILFWQMCSGVKDIHSSGFSHRDLKPNNMKVDSEGILKIFDFGISKDSENPLTVGFKGTFGFAAPEMLESNLIDKPIDIYALGIIFIFLLNKRNLQLEGYFFKIDEQHFENDFFTKYPSLKTLFHKAINYDPRLRPEIDEIKSEFDKLLLENMHMALAVHDGKQHFLHQGNRSVTLNYGSIASCEVHYTGSSFVLRNVKGEVMVNRKVPVEGEVIPFCCVIALGLPQRKSERKFVTFDISNPEVIL